MWIKQKKMTPIKIMKTTMQCLIWIRFFFKLQKKIKNHKK